MCKIRTFQNMIIPYSAYQELACLPPRMYIGAKHPMTSQIALFVETDQTHGKISKV